ncbi:MAG: YeiH family protein [Ignavibacteria bacterium]|nr:YeiH family protein [Ignavibacteria bacterium]MBT8382550.1 YeiH family protein [Ignavibacteria bacterium]MBT8392996.1 YeiH family protein [Ignavibacteria bacterium]NNJ52098.1 putative sulfate exporter family transporter [Ignavibacteriaceae bacterium]NNL22619.1 putative sulfate exporter family transporter [Ignavibacteriaceae bacterium]
MVSEKRSFISEDWLSLWIGLFVFILSLGLFFEADILGWGIKAKVWTDITESFSAISKNYESMPGIASLLLTFIFMLAILGIGVKAMGEKFKNFIIPFSLVFFISYLCWVAGHFAYIAATSDKLSQFDLSWSLNLTGEAGYIIALLAGLIIGNFFPGLVNKLKPATKPELFIKTAIVIMGGALGVKAAESLGLASSVMFRGLCAIIEAYLIYWALVYFIARKYFKFSKEWAAPLASGISICGVSAAIATGGAIRARPIIPIMVSSLVVVFAVLELILLPFLAQIFLWEEPMVAGAWMGLAVKTDGAAVASGAITDALIRAKVLAETGVNYKEGWIVMTTTTVKVFIDIFIGVWAFILAIIWCSKFDKKQNADKVRVREIWDRFPKFVLGYGITFLVFLGLCILFPEVIDNAKAAANEANGFRKMFFVLTFFTIGVVSNFKKLKEEGIGKLAVVYLLCLFGFIIWIGLIISWLFFNGVTPPVV